MDDNMDAEKILFALHPDCWKRPPGRPHITQFKTVHDDLKSHNLTLTLKDLILLKPPTLQAAGNVRHSGSKSQQ